MRERVTNRQTFRIGGRNSERESDKQIDIQNRREK